MLKPENHSWKTLDCKDHMNGCQYSVCLALEVFPGADRTQSSRWDLGPGAPNKSAGEAHWPSDGANQTKGNGRRDYEQDLRDGVRGTNPHPGATRAFFGLILSRTQKKPFPKNGEFAPGPLDPCQDCAGFLRQLWCAPVGALAVLGGPRGNRMGFPLHERLPPWLKLSCLIR